MTARGRFITLEGVDGAGKSTHASWLAEAVRSLGHRVVTTREPGGTPLGETLRGLVLSESMTLNTETLLMFAARCEHVAQVIEPALARGDWVVCDRYTDATYAYQGGGRQLGADRVAVLEQWMQPSLQPDLTWLFDVPLEIARARLADAREPDRFEREGAAFFERTRQAYHARAAAHPNRFRVVDSSRSLDDIRTQLASELQAFVGASCP